MSSRRPAPDAGDVGALLDLVDDHVSFRFGNDDTVHGRAAVAEAARAFNAAVGDVRHEFVEYREPEPDLAVSVLDVTYRRLDGVLHSRRVTRTRRGEGASVDHYDATATSGAAPGTVWLLLMSARSWPAWSPLDELVEERSTGIRDDGTREIGSVQAFRAGDNVDGERITELVHERRMGYEAAWNASMDDYRASVELTPVEGGTRIRWRGEYRARADLGEVLPPFLQGYMQQMADGLASYAEANEETIRASASPA